MRVVITGATGFLGQKLVAASLARGDQVTCIVRSSSALPYAWKNQVEVRRIQNFDELDAKQSVAGTSCDIIYNFAVYGMDHKDRNDIDIANTVNVDFPVMLLRAATDANAVMVHTGSAAEYANPADEYLLTENSPLETSKIYGRTKAEGGLAAMKQVSDIGARLAVLRLFQLYGPGEASGRLIPSLIPGLVQGQRAALSPGIQKRDFVYVDDAIEALLAAGDALKRKTTATAWLTNVCSGHAMSVADLVRELARALSVSEKLLGFGDRPMHADEYLWTVGNPNRAEELFGWVARTTPKNGIAKTLAAHPLVANR